MCYKHPDVKQCLWQGKKEIGKKCTHVLKRSSFQSKLRTWKTVCPKCFSTKDCITDMSYVL